MEARLVFILKLVKENPGIPLNNLEKLYNDGYPQTISIISSVEKLIRSNRLVRGESRNASNKGYYLRDSRELAFRKEGRCAWCGTLSVSFYCPTHKQARNERERRKRKMRTERVSA